MTITLYYRLLCLLSKGWCCGRAGSPKLRLISWIRESWFIPLMKSYCTSISRRGLIGEKQLILSLVISRKAFFTLDSCCEPLCNVVIVEFYVASGSWNSCDPNQRRDPTRWQSKILLQNLWLKCFHFLPSFVPYCGFCMRNRAYFLKDRVPTRQRKRLLMIISAGGRKLASRWLT